GDFLDAGEELFDHPSTQSLNPSGSTTFTGTFVVPTGALTGNTRMRVISNEFGSDLTGGGTYSYGETEDYTVTIAAAVANDTPATAQLMSTPTYPSCANVNGTVVGASDGVAGVVGDDVWYRFTATSSAYRIATTGASGDVSLQLMDATGTTTIVAAVNNNTANSDEVLVATSLTPSTVYAVRVINQSASPASFTICAQAFGTSGCAYGSSYSSICSNFKSIWTGATSYSVAFTDGTNNYTGSSTTTTLFGLNTVTGNGGNVLSGGLRYSTNYTATVTANYIVTLPGGAGTTTVSLVGASCSVNISAHPVVALRTSDSSSGVGVNPRAFNSFVAGEPWLCDVVSYDWRIQEIDPTLLTNIGLADTINSGSTSRFIRLNAATAPAFHTGGRYKLQVRPVFAYGPGTFGTVREVLIAGVAPSMVMENPGTEVVLVDKINEGGVFASLYPNPNAGESVNLNIAGIESESVNISIMDASGRVVWSNRYVVDGALFTTVNFDRPLAAGMYMVEMVYNGQVMTQRMMVQK
ncbi:MAG: T9SS type A sorting domain-containing protein, partial [Flavobacteriales bacterium]